MCSVPELPLRGSSVSVLITRVNLNPLCVLVEFWGNFDQDRKPAYQRMRKEIQHPTQVFHEAEGSPGDLCLVRVYETWYRARIVSRNSADYSVFLIDEGKTFRTTNSALAWGQTDFFYLPPEVEFCVLANVLPLSHDNGWSKMALEYMKTFHWKKVTACVQDVVVSQRTFLLDIPCLSKQMYEMGFAKKLSVEKFKDFVSRSLQSNKESVEPQMPNIPLGHLGQTEKQHSYMYPELQTDTVETVIVTEVTNPLRVFCQLKVFSQELSKLTEQITQHYEGRVGIPFARPENLGAPCASRGNDGKWYRSVLQQVMSSSSVAEVLQVDYGKKQFVQVEHVRRLDSEFLRMPVVTYVCSLHGIIDRGVGWTASQIDFLKSLLLNRTVIAKFEYQSLSEGVHYITLYGDENTNLNSLFGLREKCLMASKDCENVVHKSTPSQKCRISVCRETGGIDLTSLESLKGNTAMFFTESLPPHTSHMAVVQHVDSPTKFWIQTQRHADEFDQLMEGLEELYSEQARPEGFIRIPVPGLLCVAKSHDDVFYRAAICQVVDEKADVFYLDYGNTEVVDCLNLRELPLQYQKLPGLAIRCSLYGFQPSKRWDQKSTAFFSKAVLDRVIEVNVLDRSHNTHVVQVIDPLSDGEKDVSKLLRSAGFAEDVELKQTDDKPVKHCNPKADIYDPETNIAQPSSSLAVTETRSSFKEYLFPIGSTVDVTVSYIESPNDFWCQKANNTQHLKLLMQDLQDYYANSEFQSFLELACVARHPDNKMWYRALVIQRHSTPHVTVLFVDYGQTKKVSMHDLRQINSTFLKLNGQAFRCSLYNSIDPVSYSPLVWGLDATSQFKEFVDNAAFMNVALKCTVYAVMYDSQKVVFNVVDLETPFQSVCNLLFQRGLAGCASANKATLPPFRLDSYYYSTHGVKTGSEEAVSITSVKSVSEFYCQLQRNSAQMEELVGKVNKLCTQLKMAACPKNFGKVCFAKYTDELWYRAQITSTKPLTVNFVDYGNTQEMQTSDLLPIPFEAGRILSIPVQAIQVGLSDMPENVPSEVNSWFEDFVTDCTLKALVVAKEPNGKLIVELYDGQTQVNLVIREKFHIKLEKKEPSTLKRSNCKDQDGQNLAHSVSKRFSGERTCLVSKTHEKYDHNWHRLKRGNEQQKTSENFTSRNSAGSEQANGLTKSQDVPIKKDAVQMESNAGFQKESHSEFANVSKTYAKPIGLKGELPVKVLEPGLETEVLISHYNSPLDFFVQLLKDEDDINSLIEKLNNDCSECVVINPCDLHEGDLVSAEFPDDDGLYRAVVKKIPVSDTVEVEFIDFGNTAKVLASKIYTLDGFMFSFPRYSIHCSLIGVTNADQEVACNLKKMEGNIERVTCTFIRLLESVWEVKLEVNGKPLGSTSSSDTKATTKSTDEIKSTVTEIGRSAISFGTGYKNPDISDGLTVTGYASFISGPQLFWFQYAEATKLQQISDVIQKAGNARVLIDESLTVGSGCIALYSEDELWYRAKVTSRERDTLSVLFVDYGNESKVKVSEISPLPCEVSNLPPQAFACQLDGFDGSTGSWNDKAADQFFELIVDQPLKVTILKLGSIDDLQTPHFVRLQCGDLVLNDAMKKYWTPLENCKSTSLDLTNTLAVPSVDSLVVIETDSSACLAETTVRPKEPPQIAVEYLHSDVCFLTPDVEQPEIACDLTDVGNEEYVSSAVTMDKSKEFMVLMPSEDDTNKLDVDDDLIIAENLTLTETSTGIENRDHEIAMTKDPGVNTFSDASTQPDRPQTIGRTERPFESDESVLTIHENQGQNSLQESLSNDEIYVCTPSAIPEHGESMIKDHNEIITSDLGLLRRNAEKNVGSECVIWSYAHKNWCQAQILRITDDSTLVLLLEHDLEMIVDPVNIFEIIPVELLQVASDGDAEDEAIETFEGNNAVFSTLDSLPQAEEMKQKAVICLELVHVEEMVEESDIVTMMCPVIEDQPQDKDGDLVKEVEEVSDEGPSVSQEMGETFEDVSAEQKVLGMNSEVEQSLISDLKVQAQTEDTMEMGPSLEEEKEITLGIMEETDKLKDFLAVSPEIQVQNVEFEDETHLDDLIEEFDCCTDDVIVFARDTEMELDTASNDTVEGDAVETEPLPVVTQSFDSVQKRKSAGSDVNTSVSEQSDSEDSSVSTVSHLTLRVQDLSDDVIFLKAWQVSPTEASEQDSGE